MDEERVEKKTVRELWSQEVQSFMSNYPDDQGTAFLTLSGARGRDIQLLVEKGLIRLTEVSSIAQEDEKKVVAVEASKQAVATLQAQYPGLKILEVNIKALVRGEGALSWPEGDDREYCRARVVNLDFNGSLKAEVEDDRIVFPELVWIHKFAQLHAVAPHRDWCLCLTANAGMPWDTKVCCVAQMFLKENFGREPNFAQSCQGHLGPSLYEQLNGDEPVHFSALTSENQQRLLMVLVPKLIAHTTQNLGWKIQTSMNLRYGGGDRAPMVTWILHFTHDNGATYTPDATYRNALAAILRFAGKIDEGGQLLMGDMGASTGST